MGGGQGALTARQVLDRIKANIGVPWQTGPVIMGGQREWEGLAYAHDVVSAGRGKGVIALGHAVSEEPGMKVCADWLKTVVSEVPVELIPAGEPFWRVQA